jgi:hypothetical protein
VINGRKAIGIELKQTYYNQAVMNMESAANHKAEDELFGSMETM